MSSRLILNPNTGPMAPFLRVVRGGERVDADAQNSPATTATEARLHTVTAAEIAFVGPPWPPDEGRLVAVEAPGELRWRLGGPTEEVCAGLAGLIDAAARWGAGLVVVEAAGATDRPAYADALMRIGDGLARLRFAAETRGVWLGLRVPAGGLLRSPVEAFDLIDAVCSPAIGAVLDVGALPVDQRSEEWIDELGALLFATTGGALAGAAEPPR